MFSRVLKALARAMRYGVITQDAGDRVFVGVFTGAIENSPHQVHDVTMNKAARTQSRAGGTARGVTSAEGQTPRDGRINSG